jgi:hypothetical protein
MSHEVYEKLDPIELHVSCSAQLTKLHVDSAGNVLDVEGRVERMMVGHTPIELASDKILLQAGKGIIVTKSFGEVKFTSSSNAKFTFWVTALQKEKLKALQK